MNSLRDFLAEFMASIADAGPFTTAQRLTVQLAFGEGVLAAYTFLAERQTMGAGMSALLDQGLALAEEMQSEAAAGPAAELQ